MALYKNTNKASSFTAVEFTPVADGNFSFFHVAAPEKTEELKQFLTSKEIGQEIVSETKVGGTAVLITRGEKTKDEMIKVLEARGEKLHFVAAPKKPLDTWKIISMFAVPGQALQMTSAFMKKDGKVGWDLFVFAGSSLLGHIIGWIYGSQKSDDENREDFIKQKVNNKLEGHLPDGAKLPDIQDDRSSLRDGPPVQPTLFQRGNNFLKKNSVTFGELFLRYFGAFSLAFPVNQWKAGWNQLRIGAFKEAYKVTRHTSPNIRFTGLASMFGKTVALFAKAPDPYDPKPKTWLDRFREKYVFNIGGNIEAVAFATMSYDAFAKQKIVWPKKSFIPASLHNELTPNYLSGIGASMFATRYIIRNWAKYGEKEIDIKEVRAHVTDSLAQMTPDKLPQLLADTAADLTDHFKDKKLRYGEVYTQLRNDLYRYHHVAVKTSPKPDEAPVAKHTLAQQPRTAMDRVAVPTGNHAEKVNTAITASPLTMGAA